MADTRGAGDAPARRAIWPILGAFVAVVLAFLAFQAWRERREMHDYWRDRLVETLDHQAEAIGAWVAGHAADGAAMAAFPSVRRMLDPTLDPEHGAEAGDAEHLRRIIHDVCAAFGLEGIWLLDRGGGAVLREGAGAVAAGPVAALGRRVSAGPQRPLATAAPAGDGRALMALAVPVRRNHGAGDAIGAVVLFIDPATRLWPSMRITAGGARSGESLLFEHHDDGPALLSPPRFPIQGEGARYRARAMMAGALGAAGRMVEVTDQRGVPVLAASRAVRGADWSLLVKVDRAEAYRRWWGELEELAAMAALVLLAALGVGQGLARREQARVLAAELARERALQQARERVEQEMRRLNAELEARVRERTVALEAANRELESFNYSVSHDLRAPLRHIEGFLRIVVEDHGGALTDQARHYLDRVVIACQRMNALIEALLKLSRVGRQALRVQPVDLAELARAAFAELRVGAGDRQIELAVGPLPVVAGDPILLRELLDNLLANAIKFTRPRAVAHIEVGSRAGDGGPVFFVSDDGVGFDPAQVDKLFGVFQRLHGDGPFEGTGLGLSIVKRIVEKHGGRVWAEGAPDRGATFSFTLGPAAAP